MTNDDFRKTLRRLLLVQGISQSELAQRAGLTREYVNRVLQGACNPSIEVCERLVNALGYTLQIGLSEKIEAETANQT